MLRKFIVIRGGAGVSWSISDDFEHKYFFFNDLLKNFYNSDHSLLNRDNLGCCISNWPPSPHNKLPAWLNKSILHHTDEEKH